MLLQLHPSRNGDALWIARQVLSMCILSAGKQTNKQTTNTLYGPDVLGFPIQSYFALMNPKLKNICQSLIW